jgi:uncharacterized membrane protein
MNTVTNNPIMTTGTMVTSSILILNQKKLDLSPMNLNIKIKSKQNNQFMFINAINIKNKKFHFKVCIYVQTGA